MKKQSSIEWLVEQFEKIVFYTEEAKEDTIWQAIEMHKQEIIEAYEKISMDTPEEFYKNTYEKEN